MAEQDATEDDIDDILGPDEAGDEDDLPPENEEEPDSDDDLLSGEADPPARKPSRGERRFQTLSNRLTAAEERAEKAEREALMARGAAEAFRQPQGPSPEQQRAERERLEAMTPDERFEYRLEQEKVQIRQAFQQQGFSTADKLDNIEFNQLCRDNKAYRDVQKEVDNRLSDMRKQGMNVDRKILAHTIMGERAATRAGKPQRQQERDDGQRRQPQRRSGGAGSDAPAERSRGKAGKTAAERLANVKF